jgi:hypothetical protein
MTKVIIGVLGRLFESYKVFVIQSSSSWAIPFRVVLIPVSLFFYALTLLVILAILILVMFIAVPISIISQLRIPKFR